MPGSVKLKIGDFTDNFVTLQQTDMAHTIIQIHLTMQLSLVFDFFMKHLKGNNVP